jgi:predicted flap endonuclease-1-like 5' DNA nuclease
MFEQNVTLGPGTGTFTQHTFEILLMLLGAFLLGLWLGWALWAKYKQQIDKLTLENQSLNVTAEALRTELATAKTRLSTLENDSNNLASQTVSLNRNNANLREKVTSLETALAEALANNRQLDTELGLTLTPETPIADDFPLEVVVNATAPAPEPVEVPEVPQVPEPTPMVPEVPVLAESTPAAFVPVAIEEPQPPVEKKKAGTKKGDTDKSDTKLMAAAGTPDDLTVVEGIGPKIQMLLNQYGIYTYRQLAETEVDRLKEILGTAGPQLAMHDPGTWPSQANLAANDQWDTLKSVQGFLKGGKKPT